MALTPEERAMLDILSVPSDPPLIFIDPDDESDYEHQAMVAHLVQRALQEIDRKTVTLVCIHGFALQLSATIVPACEACPDKV